ncbi:MAG: hemagglutinin repeat-containing protein, partial [Endozoicomonadaceae bacterium]|nr:hemagglutinin repeat-containing protein [Endozoicomonadaceae bacterium]
MNLSGTIQSGYGDVSICTSGDIISQTVAHTLNIDDTSEYFNTIVEPVTAIHGNNVLLESKNTQLTAAEITANNDITFHADKDLIFDSIPIYKRINDIDNKSSFSSESLRWKGNTIHAGGNISTQSGRDTIIEASITAGNNVNIKAQGNTQLLSKEGYCKTHTHEKKKKKEFFGSSKKESVDDYCDVTYARPHITAGKQLNIDAEKNVTLQSAVLTAEKVKAHAEDKLIIQSVTESHSESHSRSSKNALWQSSKEKGSIDEKVLLP